MTAIAGLAAKAVVKTAEGGSINAGIWAVFALLVPILGAIILAVIKQWGPWKSGENEGRAADFARLRQDIADLKLVNTNVTARLGTAESTIVWQTVRIGQQDFVIKLMTDELEIVSPGNPIARRVRTLLDQVVPAVAPPPPAMPGDNIDQDAIQAAMVRLHGDEATV
jgi:hypothetical protein